jgi:hypothetical protein
VGSQYAGSCCGTTVANHHCCPVGTGCSAGACM